MGKKNGLSSEVRSPLLGKETTGLLRMDKERESPAFPVCLKEGKRSSTFSAVVSAEQHIPGGKLKRRGARLTGPAPELVGPVKMKVWGALFMNYLQFQNSESRA